MQIHGLNKTTLLDYPEHVAATIFTGGCNFRCPFCHNGELVLRPAEYPVIAEDEIFAFLKKRRGILSGLCITGGEPTLQPDLPDFIRKVKELGYLVKLDTNGYRPDIVKQLAEEHLIDYVAMDIKNAQGQYAKTVGLSQIDISKIEDSVDFLKKGSLSYEFRTTVVREYHTKEDFVKIADWLEGSDVYYLQAYKDNENVIKQGLSSYSKEELMAFQALLIPHIKKVEIRGID